MIVSIHAHWRTLLLSLIVFPFLMIKTFKFSIRCKISFYVCASFLEKIVIVTMISFSGLHFYFILFAYVMIVALRFRTRPPSYSLFLNFGQRRITPRTQTHGWYFPFSKLIFNDGAYRLRESFHQFLVGWMVGRRFFVIIIIDLRTKQLGWLHNENLCYLRDVMSTKPFILYNQDQWRKIFIFTFILC